MSARLLKTVVDKTVTASGMRDGQVAVVLEFGGDASFRGRVVQMVHLDHKHTATPQRRLVSIGCNYTNSWGSGFPEIRVRLLEDGETIEIDNTRLTA